MDRSNFHPMQLLQAVAGAAGRPVSTDKGLANHLLADEFLRRDGAPTRFAGKPLDAVVDIQLRTDDSTRGQVIVPNAGETIPPVEQ